MLRCPPDYNSGFCDEVNDKMCKNCWKGWYKDLKKGALNLEYEENYEEYIDYLLDIIKELVL